MVTFGFVVVALASVSFVGIFFGDVVFIFFGDVVILLTGAVVAELAVSKSLDIADALLGK